jgi:flagellar hook-associated protein 2
MASLQLSGLVSGFDWKSFVDQMISLERTPAATMQSEISTNQFKLTSLDSVKSRLTDLQTASKALNEDGVFNARAATVTGTGWSASSDATAATGTYSFNVTQLATTSRLVGAANIGKPIATSSDVTGVTLAALGTGTALTAGEFTVNGARVTVDLTDSLDTLFTRISTATGGAVTAAYNSTTDKIELTGSSPIVLGSTTDSSNFLSVTRLANNGTSSVSSGTALGTVTPGATLANARLSTAITAVDGSGNGSFTLNGVNIAYNVNTDTLNSIVTRINAASAGVTAAFDVATDRVTLTNTTTGDLGIGASESAGGLLGALGLTTGGTLSRGLNAEFTVNGGPTLTSMSNTLTADSHGIAGLTLTPAGSGGTQVVTIAADTSSARSKIDSFISAFNSLQDYIDSQTKVTSTNGKVTTSTLSDNREIQNWGNQLRSAVFASVPGLSSTLSRLDHLGIDFTGTSATLAVKDETKLTAALRDRPSEVASLFRQSSTGLSARLETLFTSYLGNLGSGGLLGTQKTNITNENTSLTQQIADIDRRLVQRRSQLEAGFIAMEAAQSLIKQMQSQLTSAFPSKSSSSS